MGAKAVVSADGHSGQLGRLQPSLYGLSQPVVALSKPNPSAVGGGV